MNGYSLSIKAFFSLLALGTLLLATGCGGSSSSDQSSSVAVEGDSSLTKTQYIKEADAICSEAAKNVTQAGEEYSRKLAASGVTNAEAQLQLPTFIKNTMLPIFEEEVGQVSSLGAPKGDEKEITTILVSFQRGLAILRKEPQALFGAPNSALAKASQMGHEYGFSHCGSLS